MRGRKKVGVVGKWRPSKSVRAMPDTDSGLYRSDQGYEGSLFEDGKVKAWTLINHDQLDAMHLRSYANEGTQTHRQALQPA